MHAGRVAHYPMDVQGGKISETVSGASYIVRGQHAAENVAGAAGQALMLDGYSTCVDAAIPSDLISGGRKATVSLWVALQAYPTVEIDRATVESVPLADCLDKDAKSGFSFAVTYDGLLSFTTYIGGWPSSLASSRKLPTGRWVNLTAVLDADANTSVLYMDGEQVAQGRCNGTLDIRRGTLRLAHSAGDRFEGPFRLTSISGLLDDLSIYDEALPQSTVQGWKAENDACFVPARRFANDICRPLYHAMPASNWTNETHGLIYSDGLYHLFFQKNANGPYMARLHWGHLSSPDLCRWSEEPIAIAPGEAYDIKGCWSGGLVQDPLINGGAPTAIYTAVDYGRATIAMAKAGDASLREWEKQGIVIDGRPAGLSDDFRDPCFFRSGEERYIIVGSGKNGVGTATLHRYNPSAGTWSNDGATFYTGRNASQAGTFWEMPNLTPMDADGNYLFTVTPLGTATGVHTLYTLGTVSSAGQLQPATGSLQNFELISRDGYGMLSPTVYSDPTGRVLALGIVPDKLPSQQNHSLGWAHTYSLPREITVKGSGIAQKPAAELATLRSETCMERKDFTLDGELELTPVSGRQAEVIADFTVGTAPFTLQFLASDKGEALLTYYPNTGEVEFDFTGLPRTVNDQGVYNGTYSGHLPIPVAKGESVKLHLFIDGSILDLFVNDTWATSVRVFPTDRQGVAMSAQAFEGPVHVNNLQAWVLDPNAQSSVSGVRPDAPAVKGIYTPDGIRLPYGDASELPSGIYIIDGVKRLIP